jgi:iron complex outermembrane receptor protein
LKIQTTRGRLLASTMLAAMLASAAPAFAQDTNAEGTEVEGIVVTGSRIVRQDYVANSPIATVTGEQVVANADVTLDTFLNTLPQVSPAGTTTSNNPPNGGQANIDLRGLGANRNIVLVDGRRAMVSASNMTVDLNTIPQALIQNIEIITGGAGATYGADAIAGVVNVILKKDFEGIDVRGSYSNSTEYWDAEEHNFSAVIGGNFADGKGNAVFAFDRAVRQAISKGQRAFSAFATSTTGTPPEGAIRWATAGATTGAGNAIPLAAIQALFGTSAYGSVAPGAITSSSGSLGFNLDGSLYYAGLSNDPLRQVANYKYPVDVSVNQRFYPDFYSYNFDAPNLLVLPLDRYSFMTKINYELDNGVEFFASAGWTEYTAGTALAPTPLPTVTIAAAGQNTSLEVGTPLVTPGATACPTSSGLGRCAVGTNLVVPVTNPFIPTDLATLLAARTGDDVRLVGSGATEPFLFGFRPLGFGPRFSQYQNTVIQYLGGVRAPLGDRFELEAYISQGRTEIDLTQFGNIDTQRLQNVLADPDQDPSGSNGACADNNFFGDRPTSATCRAYLESPVSQRTTFDQTVGQAFVRGDVFEVPAGMVGMVFGAEYRGFEYASRYLSSPGPFSGFTVGDPDGGTNAFYDLFAETLIPIAKDMPFIQNLEVSLGARYSWSEFEDKINSVSRSPRGSASYKIEANWEPIEYARIRASYQTSVREPNFGELFSSGGTNPQVFDPCSPFTEAWLASTSTAAGSFRALCASQGVGAGGSSTTPGSQASLETDGNPNLNPEKGKTVTVGVVLGSPWEGQWFDRFRASVDYYKIEITDPILVIDTNTGIAACFNYYDTNPTYDPNYLYCAAVSRSGDSLTNASLNNPDTDNGRFPGINGGSQETSGIDFQVDYGFDWEWLGMPSMLGSVRMNLLVSHVLEFLQSDSPDLPVIDYTGTISYFGAGLGTSWPEWKAVLNTDFDFGAFGVGARLRYIDAMLNRQFVQYPGEDFLGFATTPPNVSATYYLDVDGTWDVNDNVQLKLGVNNALDQAPRIYAPNVQSSTDPSTYDVVGRRVFGQIKLRF